jgi:hypothetical protein
MWHKNLLLTKKFSTSSIELSFEKSHPILAELCDLFLLPPDDARIGVAEHPVKFASASWC